MKLEKIITLASESVRIRFVAMERSLRATGCNLPLWVIPYNNQRFDLPPNAVWWEIPEILQWLDSHNCHKAYRKYQCLVTGNYQFVDTDVVFLRNPEEILADKKGFITSCGHWRAPDQTITEQSKNFLRKKYTLWEKYIFNTGQYACDQVLYNFHDLKATAESPGFKETCIEFIHHEQPGLNLLVNASNISVSNITLPPTDMESTWAGDYKVSNPEETWTVGNKPYIIHWAGCDMDKNYKVDEYFTVYLTSEENYQWQIFVVDQTKKRTEIEKGLIPFLRKVKRALKIILH